MLKHIVGFTLFSLIVGTSALIASIFYASPKKLTSITYNYDHEAYSCRKKKRKKRPPRRIYDISAQGEPRAVFDRQTDLLITSNLRGIPTNSAGMLYFHFYANDGVKTEHLLTKRVPLFRVDSPVNVSSFEGLSDIDQDDNVYLITEFQPYNDIRNKNAGRSAPDFDRSIAIPVLIKQPF